MWNTRADYLGGDVKVVKSRRKKRAKKSKNQNVLWPVVSTVEALPGLTERAATRSRRTSGVRGETHTPHPLFLLLCQSGPLPHPSRIYPTWATFRVPNSGLPQGYSQNIEKEVLAPGGFESFDASGGLVSAGIFQVSLIHVSA